MSEGTVHESLLGEEHTASEPTNYDEERNDIPLPRLSHQSNQQLTDRIDAIPPVLITKTSGNIEVIHQAKYAPSFCCSQWDYQRGRRYFYVLENGFEVNAPFVFPTCLDWFSFNWLCCCNIDGMIACCFKNGLCCWVPPNSCCLSVDSITKTYFDRGFYDRQCLFYHRICGNDPIFTGPPTIYTGPIKYVCCCMDCPDMFNEFASCNVPILCGEHISVRPCSEVMGCKLEACWCCNCCGICGIKDGEPICVREIPGGCCLDEGEGAKLAEALNGAHAAWIERKGLQKLQ